MMFMYVQTVADPSIPVLITSTQAPRSGKPCRFLHSLWTQH